MKKALSFLLTAAMIMSMLVFPVSAADTHTHCWCEGADTVPAGHECAGSTTWETLSSLIGKVNKNQAIIDSTTDTHFYRDNTTATSVIVDGVDAFLCLNGKALRAQTVVTLKNGASLTLCDCSGSNTGVLSTTKNTPVTIGSGCTLNLMSGTIRGTYSKMASRITIKVNAGGILNIYGGIITAGNSAASSASNVESYASGGNIQINGGTVTMYGGTISGGRTVYSEADAKGGLGGNIFVENDGSFTMYDGLITGGESIKYGGNIGANGGDVYIYGGVVTGGYAGTHGGNISVLSGSFTMHAGTVSNGKSGSQGGNISAAGGTATIKGGSVTGGQSGLDETSERRYGGNISVNNNGDLFVEGGEISGGNSPAYGGNIGLNDAGSSVTVSGATLSGGEAGTYGGSIGVNSGSVTISGTETSATTEVDGASVTTTTYSTNITGGTSTTYGGNIGIVGGTVNLQGGKVADGHAGTHGGNIGVGQGKINMTGGAVCGGTAEENGNGMSIRNTATVTVTGGVFVDTGINVGGTSTLKLGGDAVIYNVYLNDGRTITLDETAPFTGSADISMHTPGDFLATTTDYTANFSSASASYGVAFTGTAMTLKAYTAKVGTKSYILLQDAIDNAGDGYVKLVTDVTEDVVINDTVYMDLNGKVLTSNITGEGMLCGMDNSGDTYVTPAGRIEGTVSCQIADHIKTSVTGAVRRYAAIADETGYTFHRYYMGITHMSLKPGVSGVGYKAVFHADEQVQALLAEEGSFGYILQLDGYEAQTCALDLDQFTSGKTVTLRLTGIDVENFGTTAIKGKVFMKFGNEVIASGEYSYTMKDMVETAAKCVAQLSAEQMTALQNMCKKNSEAMKDWNIDAILNWTAPAE